jgi:hypothetical protein
MSETRTQVWQLLQRAAQLRAQGQEIQRKLMEILAEIGRLTARYESKEPKDPFGDKPQLWRKGPDDPRTPNTQL